MDFVEIEVLGWDKYNPRKDYKKPWWFALSNTITSDAMFSEFSDAEFRAWIHILCTASVQNTHKPRLFIKHMERSTGIKRSALMSAIDKLKILKVIQTQAGICTDSVRDLCSTEQNSTIQNRTNNIAQADAFASFFEFWSGYPRKVGKGKTQRLYEAAIKSGARPEDLLLARDKYREHLRREGTEARFIKHGPTFLAQWRDWLDPETGQAESFAEKTISIHDIDLPELGAG